MPAFQATCLEQLQGGMAPANNRPVRVFGQDERRFGWLTVRRRRRTTFGVPPVGTVPQVFAWFYVDGAGAPTTGERFCLERPYLNTESFQRCGDAVAQAVPDSLHRLLLANSGIHRTPRLRLPSNVRLVFCPPSGPELNPIERLWRDLKDALAWQHFTRVVAQQDDVGQL